MEIIEIDFENYKLNLQNEIYESLYNDIINDIYTSKNIDEKNIIK